MGRLRPEKNVRFLAEIEDSLRRDGIGNYRFLIVGDGSERAWLERRLRQADFTGELFGEALARAYANMDLFVFPSETDTFGNVVMEAMASGTPAVVTSKGGPKYQVQNGVSGFVATGEQDFIARIKQTMASPQLHRSLAPGQPPRGEPEIVGNRAGRIAPRVSGVPVADHEPTGERSADADDLASNVSFLRKVQHGEANQIGRRSNGTGREHSCANRFNRIYRQTLQLSVLYIRSRLRRFHPIFTTWFVLYGAIAGWSPPEWKR